MGTEHEFSVNDNDFRPLPIVDRIIEQLNGRLENEFAFGDINLSKELQKNVIEIVPSIPHTSIASLESMLYGGLLRFNKATDNRYKLLGLGMHPYLTLDQTSYWDHEDKEIYDEYDRLFSLKQHGWLNIQALQINVHYDGEEEMVSMFNRMRSLIPYVVAVSAASPFVEGKTNGAMDNRLLYYRQNQKRVPLICNNIVPEKLRSRQHHDEIIESIYSELRKIDGKALCEEWIDSRGVIIRYHRECLELKVPDESECIRSDMALTAFVLALLRADLDLEEDHDSIVEMNEQAMKHGTSHFRPELRRLYAAALKVATKDELRYLPIIGTRIEHGSLAEILFQQVKEGREIFETVLDLEECLRNNRPYMA